MRMKIETAMQWLDDASDPDNGVDRAAAAKLRLVIAQAQEFSKAWAVWSVNDRLTPGCDVIESACTLLEELGIEQPNTD
jgi:hypothetical protein